MKRVSVKGYNSWLECFFSLQDSKFPTYARMASFMESQKPKVFENSNADGVNRVLESPGNRAQWTSRGSYMYFISKRFFQMRNERVII